jgi:hypothetical protein
VSPRDKNNGTCHGGQFFPRGEAERLEAAKGWGGEARGRGRGEGQGEGRREKGEGRMVRGEGERGEERVG